MEQLFRPRSVLLGVASLSHRLPQSCRFVDFCAAGVLEQLFRPRSVLLGAASPSNSVRPCRFITLFPHCCSKAQPQSFSFLASRTSPSKHTAARKRSTSKFLVSRFLHTLSLKNQSGSSSGPEKFVPKLWETFSNTVQQHVDHVRATSNLPFLLFCWGFEPCSSQAQKLTPQFTSTERKVPNF